MIVSRLKALFDLFETFGNC